MEPARQVKNEIVGKKLKLTGNVRYNDYQDKLELMVSSLDILGSNTPIKSASKEDIPEEVSDEVLKEEPEEVLSEEDIEVEEIVLDE
jgi:hypothetical protein